MGLSEKLLKADTKVENRMADELNRLKAISEQLPFQLKLLLDGQSQIDGSIYYNGFLDDLGIVIPHLTSLGVKDELKGIKKLVDELMNS